MLMEEFISRRGKSDDGEAEIYTLCLCFSSSSKMGTGRLEGIILF
jgi:hypothetical protein